MKRVWRWTKRIALGVLGFTVLAVAITIGALHTSWGRNRVRTIAEEQLQSAFPGSTIGRIEGSVLGDLIARDIVIMGRDHRPLVTVESVRIEAAILPLFGKTVRVKSIAANNVVVYAHDQGPAPAKPPEPATEGPSEPSAWSIELPDIAVDGGRVEIETASGTEVVDGLAANVALTMKSGEPLIASVLARGRWRGQPLAINALATNGDALGVPYAHVALGDAGLSVLDARVDGTRISATLLAHAPAALVRTLAGIELPGDVALLGRLSPQGSLRLGGTLGAARVDVLAQTNLEATSARALVTATLPDLSAVSRGAVTGAGTVVVALAGDPQHASGIVSIAGDAQGSAGSALFGIEATPKRADVLVAARGETAVTGMPRQAWRAGGSLALEETGGWVLRESTLRADASSAMGNVTASLTATGPLTPAPALRVTGTIDGRRVRYDDVSVGRVHAAFAASDLPARPTGSVQLDVADARQGTLVIPSVALGARGVLEQDGTIEVDLDRHRVRTADGMTWGGAGGHVRVTEQSIAVTGFATGSGASRITAQALIGRTSDQLSARVAARDIALAIADPALGGTLDGELDVTRKGGLWKGTANLDAHQIAIPHRPVLDGKLAVTIDKRRVTARATASNPAIGSATLDLDVIGPRDITDPRAWQRLERSSIQGVRVALSKIDASKLGASGNLDGELAISASDAGGKVDLRGVVTGVGTLDSQLALGTGDRGDIAVHGTLHLGGIDPVDVDAVLALPVHPFDPAGWEQLGRATLRDATIEAKRLAFDPALMKRFGIDSPWRGWAAIKIHVGAGARTSDFTVAVHELRDGPLTRPVDVEVSGGSDASGVHADVNVRADKLAFALAARSPLSVEAMLAGEAKRAPIEATLTVPASSARDVALLIGRDDVLGGTIAGTVQVGGTIEAPTGRAQLAIDNLSVAAGLTRKPPTLEKLEVDARWLGVQTGFELELTGHEQGGRLLKISARGKPDALDGVVASIEAANFDIAPFLAFAPPGPAVGMRGLVSGVLKLKGLDPDTGDVRGRLVISEARVPLAAELGNLRSATLEIDIVKKEIHATLDGKIGRGTIKGKAVARLTGSMPTAAELTLALRQVSPIGEIQPVIDADITGYLVRTKTKWTGKLAVKNGNIYVPPEAGNELLITGTPSDLVFIDAQPIIVKPKRHQPTAPWLVAQVDIEPTKLLVDDTDFRFDGVASGQLQLSLGQGGIGLDGAISTERGRVDVLGRAYRLDHGIVDFDGSLDPRLDIVMLHDFRAMTLTVEIRGRSSTPDLRLSSDGGAYSQSQLLAFLAGATPSDDPAAQSGDAVASGSLTILSSRVGKKINEKIPLLKFDTINYEAQTASSSRAIRIGKQIGEHTYLNFRQRFEPRPDENPHEAVVEWELRRDILLEGTGGERAVGADLLWRKRW